MSRYVDAVVIPVPTDQLDAYRELAAAAGTVWIEHGALEYFEGVGDDIAPDVDGGAMRTFPKLAGSAADESIVFAYIVFESREHRDEVTAAVRDDPAYQEHFAGEMPFDPARMATGGFRSIVSYED